MPPALFLLEESLEAYSLRTVGQASEDTTRACFTAGSQLATHRQSTRRAYVPVARSIVIVCKASLASHRATARLTSRSYQKSSLVDASNRHRYDANPGYRAVNDRRWWTPPAPTANRRPCQRLTRFYSYQMPRFRANSEERQCSPATSVPYGTEDAVVHYKEANGGATLLGGGAAVSHLVRPVGRDRF